MPVTAQSPIATYTANGSVTSFAFPFRVIKQADLLVYGNGTQITTGFTVSGLDVPAGGTVTFTVAPANGVLIRLQRRTTVERATDYVEGGQLAAATLDNDFDRIVMMLQDVNSLPLVETSDGLFDAENKRIKNVASPVNGGDAVNKTYHDGTWIPQMDALLSSATSASNIAVSSRDIATDAANTAVSSRDIATSASNSAIAARDVAISSSNTAVSSRDIATSASSSAGTSASSASSSATQALSSANSAASSAITANNSANSANSSSVDAYSYQNSASSSAAIAQAAAASASLVVISGLGFTNSTAYDYGYVTDTAVLFPTDYGTV